MSIPDTVGFGTTSFKVTGIAGKALYRDTAVQTVSIGCNVKSIGKNAFASCTKLVTITGGDAIKTIGDSAFSGCKALRSFPVLKKLQKIGANAFRNCVKLPAFTLWSTVASVGKNAFYGCSGLKAIEVKTKKLTEKNVGAAAFKGINKKAVFTCPKKKLKAYKKLFIKKGAPKTCTFK